MVGIHRPNVLRDAMKRYACPTDAEARISFIKRKEALIRIKSAAIEEARVALRKLSAMPSEP